MKHLLGLITLILSFSLSSFSQEDTSSKGIKWTTGLSWEQVKEKAKQENKYIFVDAYATWCVPCKVVDKEVYTNDTVGLFMNDKFINYKLQFDVTAKDNDEVKRGYITAQAIQVKYPLQGFPSFLFFDPDGNLLYKKVGYRNSKAFIQMAKEALDPERKKVYTALQEYKQGEKDYTIMPELIEAAKDLMDEKDLSRILAEDYKYNYLDKLQADLLFTKKNLQFILNNGSLLKSTDPFFKLIYIQPEKVDSLTGIQDAGLKMINYIIGREEINEKLYNSGRPLTNNPDWNSLRIAISTKYDKKHADALLPGAQLSFFYQVKNWNEYAKLIEIFIKQYLPVTKGTQFANAVGSPIQDDSWGLNTVAWNIFLSSNDKELLRKAIIWSDLSIRISEPGIWFEYYDTKANLTYKLNKLYKIGKAKDAIEMEEKAIKLATKKGVAQQVIDQYSEALKKMKLKQATWPLPEKK